MTFKHGQCWTAGVGFTWKIKSIFSNAFRKYVRPNWNMRSMTFSRWHLTLRLAFCHPTFSKINTNYKNVLLKLIVIIKSFYRKLDGVENDIVIFSISFLVAASSEIHPNRLAAWVNAEHYLVIEISGQWYGVLIEIKVCKQRDACNSTDIRR